VGRFLLALHKEEGPATELSDNLCTALQILNHLQDIRLDWTGLGRIYLPNDWLAEAGATHNDFSAIAMNPQLRSVVHRTLDGCDQLLQRAAPLPSAIRSKGLRIQAATTLHLARRLSRKLRQQDPLAGRVAPDRMDFLAAGLHALLYRRETIQ